MSTITSYDDARLTPEDVQAMRFPPARLGRRGLNEEHVRS
jgi:DivIVA domain-containing protein